MPREHSDPPLEDEAADRYWSVAKRPLQILIFLLPLVVIYEIGLAWQLRTERGITTNVAHESLLQFFASLGVGEGGGLYLGGVVIVVVLFIWHVLAREPWRIDFRAAGLMAVESTALTLPLIVLGLLVQRGLAATVPAPVEVELASLSMGTRLVISIGAGLYEELLFRMLLIAIIHTLLVDLAGLKNTIGVTVAVVPLHDASGAFSLQKVVFYFLAGLYLGAVYVGRGFGIVVAVHAIYDIVTVVVIPEPAV
jgi:hypothetical protein